MNRKPGILIFLALLQLISPIGDIVIGAYLSHTTPWVYFKFLSVNEPLRFLLGHLGLQVLCAFAIFSVKMWSLPVFIVACGVNILETALSWRFATNAASMSVLISAHLLNIGLISYFLLPAVRDVYLNRRLRWWENNPRYKLEAKGVLFDSSGSVEVNVHDISIGGTFISGIPGTLPDLNRDMTIQFTYEGVLIQARGKIRHKSSNSSDRENCGVEFFDIGPDTKKALKKLTTALEFLGVERRPERQNAWNDLKNWIVGVVTRGEGLIPNTAAVKAIIERGEPGKPVRRLTLVDPDITPTGPAQVGNPPQWPPTSVADSNESAALEEKEELPSKKVA